MAARGHEADLPLFRERRINDPEEALRALAAEAVCCTRCPLYKNATQTVFGEGPADAALVLVGEQPGDQEDLQGRPFVGPAGKVLDRTLEEAGLGRREIYFTTAVKQERAARQTAPAQEAQHQRDRRLPLVAGQRAGDRSARRGRWRSAQRRRAGCSAKRSASMPIIAASSLCRTAGHGVITVHPSYLLRLQEERDKRREFELLIKDLRFAAEAARKARR
jgi:DNA polymerase